MPAAPPSLLGTYLAAVCGLGLAALVGVVALTSWPSVAHGAWWPIGFLAVATLVGETKPLLISRSGRSSGTVSTSGPFVLALVAVAGVDRQAQHADGQQEADMDPGDGIGVGRAEYQALGHQGIPRRRERSSGIGTS